MIPLGILAQRQVAAGSDPLDVYSWAWRFESDSLTGYSNGDPVASWPDMSGNGRHAEQATPADRPTYVAGAFGSLPALTFGTGTTKKLVTPAVAAISQPATYFVVGALSNTNSYLFDGITANNRHAVYRTGGSDAFLFAGSGLAAGIVTSAAVHVFQFSTSTSRHWVNGGTSSTPGNAGTQTITGLTIGNRVSLANSCAGNVGAVMGIAGALSIADLNTIGGNLADKYGFTWTEIT